MANNLILAVSFGFKLNSNLKRKLGWDLGEVQFEENIPALVDVHIVENDTKAMKTAQRASIRQYAHR